MTNAARPLPSSRKHRNPFPSVPEVCLGRDTAPIVRIETEAVRKVWEAVDDYLGTPTGQPAGVPHGTGRTLAIIGDFGSGKSHLAAELIHRLQDAATQTTEIIVLTLHARPGDTAVSLYRRLFRAAGHRDGGTLGSVDATGGALSLSALHRHVGAIHAQIRSALVAGDTAESHQVVLHFPRGPAVTDVELTRRLQERLAEITGDAECGNVLSLLMHERDEISNAAWLWLGGSALDDTQQRLLADRGVGQAITTDLRACRVLDAMSRLFAAAGTRLVLVIDEAQALWDGDGQAAERVAGILNPLLGWAGDTGAMLVLCGLADFWHALPESVHQRTGIVLRPTRLTLQDTRDFIQESQLEHNGERRLLPFSTDTTKMLHEITGGRPRMTIALCHHAYRHSDGGRVTAKDIREAGRDFSGEETAEEIRGRVAALCSRLGHRVLRDHPLATHADAVADLWIPAGHPDSGCAIVVAGSVLDLLGAKPLIRRGRALLSGTGEVSRVTVLVVAGLLANNLAEDMAAAYTRVLEWGRDDFDAELGAMLKAPLPLRETRTEGLLLRRIEQEVRDLKAARDEDRRFIEEALARQFEEHRRQSADGGGSGRRATAEFDFGGEAMEQQLNVLFDNRLMMIREALNRSRELWRQLFHPGVQPLIERLHAPGGRTALPEDLTATEVREATTALLALDHALAGFALGVIELRARAARSGRGYRQELRQICDRFDGAAEALLSRIPGQDADRRRTVPRVLDVDRAVIAHATRKFGHVVFDTIHDEEFRP